MSVSKLAAMVMGRKIKLLSKRLSDVHNEYRWRTDPELAELDATDVPLTTFSEYLSIYTRDLRYHSSRREEFAIETLEGKHIGNCLCYDVDETRGEAELGIMIGERDYWNAEYGTDAVTTLVNYMFSHRKLDRIYLKTLAWNIRAQKCFKKCGFTEYNRVLRDGYNFLLMEIYRKEWEQRQAEA